MSSVTESDEKIIAPKDATKPDARKNASVSAVAPKQAAIAACFTNPTTFVKMTKVETANDEATMPAVFFELPLGIAITSSKRQTDR